MRAGECNYTAAEFASQGDVAAAGAAGNAANASVLGCDSSRITGYSELTTEQVITSGLSTPRQEPRLSLAT